jgi:hypothetical protein
VPQRGEEVVLDGLVALEAADARTATALAGHLVAADADGAAHVAVARLTAHVA